MADKNELSPTAQSLLVERDRLQAEVEYLKLELSGVETAKADLAEKLGCADEPRWKWMLMEADDLRKDAERYRWLRDSGVQLNVYRVGAMFDKAIDAIMAKDGAQ